MKCYICDQQKPARLTGVVHYLKGRAICSGCWKKHFGEGTATFADIRNAKQAEVKNPAKETKPAASADVPPKVEKSEPKEKPDKPKHKIEITPVKKEEPKPPNKEEESMSWF